MGALPDAAARLANGTALAAFRDYLRTNGKYGEVPAGRLEYTMQDVQNGRNAGFQLTKEIPGFVGAGSHPSNGTVLVQYATNHPVLTLSDIGTNNSDSVEGATYGGFAVSHGVSQTGNTSADGVLFGRMWGSTIRDILVSPFLGGGNFPAWNGLKIGLNTQQFFFSNGIGVTRVLAAQNSFEEHNSGGTGNYWEAAYNGSGTFGSRVQMSGPPVNYASGGVDYGARGQLNIEWCATTSSLAAAMGVNSDGLTIDHIHLEGVQVGLVPANNFDLPIIQVIAGHLNYGSLKALDTWIASVNAGGTPRLFGSYGDSRITGRQTLLTWSGAGTSPEAVASTAFRAFKDGFSPTGYKAHVDLGPITLRGNTGAFSPDDTLAGGAPGAANAISSVGSYRYNKARSRTDGAVITMANANLTVYGAHRNSQIRPSVTLTANRTLTLSDKVAASGAGATSVRMAGDVIEVFRTAGGAFDLVVADQTGAPLFTFSGSGSANTAKSFEWSGTAWTAL